MKEFIKILLSEGLDEYTIHKVLDLIEAEYKELYEAWSGQVVSKQGYESPSTQKEHGYTSKRVEMSPDEYLKKCAKMYRRKGVHQKRKNVEKMMSDTRKEHTTNGENSIENYKKRISDPNDKVHEPWIMYNPYGNNNNDQQDGIHRVMAAKELGMKKIPVHIFHNSDKRDATTKRYYKRKKQENKKEAGDNRAYSRRIEALRAKDRKRDEEN